MLKAEAQCIISGGPLRGLTAALQTITYLGGLYYLQVDTQFGMRRLCSLLNKRGPIHLTNPDTVRFSGLAALRTYFCSRCTIFFDDTTAQLEQVLWRNGLR